MKVNDIKARRRKHHWNREVGALQTRHGRCVRCMTGLSPFPKVRKAMFELGQKVEWTSQAAGVAVYKQGVVVEVVPAGLKPSKRFKSLYRANGVQTVKPRRSTSYVIELTAGEGARKHYWPRVDRLHLITPEEEEFDAGNDEEDFDEGW